MDAVFQKLAQKMIAEGYVSVNKHPSADLYIYNYTNKTQFEWVWNRVTLLCRGLILDADWNIVARPFPKFFNLEERQPQSIPLEPFEVYEKMDGSLGILYFWKQQPYIATRGSFASEQALRANEMLHHQYAHALPHLNPQFTYLFEIIYPENRIVVDYGKQSALVLLGILDNATGKDLPLKNIGFPLVKRYNGISDLTTIKTLKTDNQEGFVIRFQSGFRIKVKFEEYKRLHRIMANVSSKSIWENLMAGKSLEEMIEHVPDEFYNWVRKTEQQFRSQYTSIEAVCQKEYRTFPTRKETAHYFLTQGTYPAILFSMLDGKDYSDRIWRLLKPTFEKPFREVK